MMGLGRTGQEALSPRLTAADRKTVQGRLTSPHRPPHEKA
jgi:hypothetical protein